MFESLFQVSDMFGRINRCGVVVWPFRGDVSLGVCFEVSEIHVIMLIGSLHSMMLAICDQMSQDVISRPLLQNHA